MPPLRHEPGFSWAAVLLETLRWLGCLSRDAFLLFRPCACFCLPQVYELPFLVALDHRKEAIVVAVRGTMSLQVRGLLHQTWELGGGAQGYCKSTSCRCRETLLCQNWEEAFLRPASDTGKHW